MASIEESTNIDMSQYRPIDPPQNTGAPDVSKPEFNAFLRTPIPLINASSDSLRQFYRGGIPQYRVVPL